ncbi:MAG: ATP-binding protein, partial [Candidatus Electrothrix sp. GM3_4]|nr:ATP-binding protein [Candidatus Electrothrix sp. GM3_4]
MQYVKECLQLLHWIYFKPYTLIRHVQAICPKIYPYEDIAFARAAAEDSLGLSAEEKANPDLQRYDTQCWWLMVLVPIVVICLYAFLVESTSYLFVDSRVFQSKWWSSGSFLLGWLIGLLLIRGVKKRLGEFSAELLFALIMVGIASLVLFEKQFAPDSFMVAGGVVIGVLAGVLFNVFNSMYLVLLYGVIGGVLSSVPLQWSFDIPLAILIGAVLSLGFSTECNDMIDRGIGMVIGIAIGILVGVKGGMMTGVAFGISYIIGMLRFYFWLPELLWMFLLAFWPSRAAAKLSWLPPQFDQVIVLPLPFLPGLIAASYQENQAAARQAINYLIFSAAQRRAAHGAMFLIATEECRRCQTTGEIATLREQLAWIFEESSPGLAACLEISRGVAVSYEASSHYRKAQYLDKVLQEIDRQRNALAIASAREATAFGSVLDSWQRILETACRTLREQAKNSDEVPQVYLAGPALDPNKAGPLFKGRRDLFRQIETLTLSAQHPTLVMHGGRRSGKTSTLNYLPKWLPSDILPLLIDGQSLATTSTLSGFSEDFADQIIRSSRKMHSLKLPVLESVMQSDDPFVTLRRWLDAVEQAVPDKTLLLCLDEFERLDEIVRATDSRAPLNFLRHLIQHRDRWTLLFTGAQTTEELPAYWSDYLINCETLR